MDESGVLILSEDGGDYLPHLRELAQKGIPIDVATNAEEGLAAYRGQSAVLAQPDLAAAVMDGMPGLQWIQSTWAGVTPLVELGRRDYRLTGVKEVFGPQMAQYVLGYMLEKELKIRRRREEQARRRWWNEPSESLEGKTLGLMGTGSIGGRIARDAKGFGMGVWGLNRSGRPTADFERIFPVGRLHSFLAEPDYLVGALPDTTGTAGLLDAAAFRAMKDSCYLINVGRGTVLDEGALVDALAAGELAGAVLDVFREEPLPADSPLWDTPGLTVTAHVAAISRPADIAAIFRDNFRRFRAGKALRYEIDFDQGY